MKDVAKQKIYEIRIEKINNKTEKETFYFIYANIDNKVKIIGRSTIKPKILSYNCITD
jgi:hypothetical protein